MSYIEIKEHETPVGMECIAIEYLGDGLYWNKRMNSYYAVRNGCVSMICIGGRLTEIAELPAPPAHEFDPIAMLAVALHANAAEKYVKKGME
jgi:hypothetical protein